MALEVYGNVILALHKNIIVDTPVCIAGDFHSIPRRQQPIEVEMFGCESPNRGFDSAWDESLEAGHFSLPFIVGAA